MLFRWLKIKSIYVFLASLVLIILLILWIGPINIFNALKTANWWLVLLAVFIHLLVLIIRAVRWGFLIKQTTKLKKNFIVDVISSFADNLSPLKTAGEFLGALAAKQINEVSLPEGLSAGLTERFFDTGVVGVLLIVTGLIIAEIRILALLGGLITLGVAILIYLINWREDTSVWIYSELEPLINRFSIKKELLDNFYERFISGLHGMVEYTHSFTSYKNLTFVISLTLGSWILECVRLYTVIYAFHVEIGFIAVIAIFLLSNVVGELSSLPGGIGALEISLTGLFVLFGIPSALAGSIVIVDRLISFWMVNIMGIIFASYYSRNILDDIKSYILDLKSPYDDKV